MSQAPSSVVLDATLAENSPAWQVGTQDHSSEESLGMDGSPPMQPILDVPENQPSEDSYPEEMEFLDENYSSFSGKPSEEISGSTRRPPWSNAAEQSVLGAVLLDNSVMDLVGELLESQDFYTGAHRVIYQAIRTLLDRGEPADPVVLHHYLQKHEELDSVGGGGYLAQLMDTVPTTANAVFYARLVRDKSLLRDLAQKATKIVDDVYQGGKLEVDRLLDEAEQSIFAVGEGRDQRRSSYSDMKSILMPVLHNIEALMKRKDAITGVPSGFIDLDKKLAGLQKSDLLILAGRPAMGKTSFAMNIAANAALDHQVPVAVFSLEMSKEQLVTRLLSSTANIDAQQLRTGWLKDGDYGRMVDKADTLSKAPIYVDDTPAISISALRAKARRLKREKKIQLILVDYLQLMQGEDKVENRVQEISQISRGLKSLAKELDLPVIALSQLSRKLEERPNKRPILSDLRESGAIEQDADVVMFVFREEVYKENDTSLEGLAEIIIAKHRNGPTGTIKLSFLKQFTRFENHAHQSY